MAFITRELDNALLLQFPKRNSRHYEEIVKEKVDHLRREIRDDIVEGDRRRVSMLVEGIISPDLYLAACADFILTIAETYKEELRPAQDNGRRGKFYSFEEGILCQTRTVHPGMEAKVTTGSDKYSGWYAAILSIIRRLILNRNDWNHDYATTMSKTNLNFAKVDKMKAITLMTSLKEHCATLANEHIRKRGHSVTGKIVFDYINESAAFLKRLFMADTEARLNRANRLFENPMENDDCFSRLRTRDNRTVLRFCTICKG